MIARRFIEALEHCPDDRFVLSPSESWTYADFFGWSRAVAGELEAVEGAVFGCHMADSPRMLSLMLAADLAGKSLLLLNRDFTESQLRRHVGELGVDVLVTDAEMPADFPCTVLAAAGLMTIPPVTRAAVDAAGSDDSELLIMTSGTTGRPKCARYDWRNLFAQIASRKRGDEAARWLLAYRLSHFAGVQVLAHVIASRSTLVVPLSGRVADAVDAMMAFGVSHVSSTPTFWRFAMALLRGRREELATLKHISLGSEAVSAALLRQLGELFPEARIVQIYASTESGSCVSVADMKPGLPVSVLSRPEAAAVRFRIEDGELFIKSRNGMTDYLNEASDGDHVPGRWRATGDMVRVEDGRIVFLGRRSETINVGGVKVLPLEVEVLVQAAPGVRLARVYGKRNPVMGQIVAVDYVADDACPAERVEDGIREVCMALPRYSRPQSFNRVESLETSNNKLVRR